MTDLDLDEQRLRRTLRKVAEGTPVPPVDETLLIRVPPRSPHGHRRLLISVLATVVVVAGFAIAIAYGPRSSDVGGPTTGNTNVTSYPKVSETWAVPTPAGYVALKNRNRNDHLLGVQTLKSASYQRPGLRQAGWRSSIAEDWAPKALFRSDHPYSIDQTIFLTIDQFGSSTEAASYQTKLAALFLQQVPGEGPRVRLTVQGVPGAVAVQQVPGSSLSDFSNTRLRLSTVGYALLPGSDRAHSSQGDRCPTIRMWPAHVNLLGLPDGRR
jgi:hypothetical protein